MWWRMVVRLAAGILALFGIGAGATMILAQDNGGASPDCELGITFKTDIERTDWIQPETLEVLPLIDPDAKAWLQERHLYHYDRWLSPDSTRLIVYELPAENTTDPMQFYIFDIPSASLTPITFNTAPYAPTNPVIEFTWSTDGTQIAYTSLMMVYVLDLDTGGNWPLINLHDAETRAQFEIAEHEGMFGRRSSIEWSPDGQRLILTYNDDFLRAIMVEVDGSNPRWALPFGRTTYQLTPTWGESGDILYYMCRSTTLCTIDIAHNLEVEVINMYDILGEWPSNIDVGANGIMLFSFSQLIQQPNSVLHLAIIDLNTREITDLYPTLGRIWDAPPSHWYCRPPQFNGGGA